MKRKKFDDYGTVSAVLPAQPGWYAEFRSDAFEWSPEAPTYHGAKHRNPVAAWVAVLMTDDEDNEFTFWRGLVLYADGPDYADTMQNFIRYTCNEWDMEDDNPLG